MFVRIVRIFSWKRNGLKFRRSGRNFAFLWKYKKAFSFQSYFSPVGGSAELLYKVSFQHTIESNKIDFTFNFLSESLFFAIKMNSSFIVLYGINAGLNCWFPY